MFRPVVSPRTLDQNDLCDFPASRRAKKLERIQGGACQTDRVDVVSPQKDSSHLETDPEGAREEPCRASHMTGSGVQSEWLLEKCMHQRHLEHLEQARWREPVQGVGVETPGAAVVDTTRRGAA